MDWLQSALICMHARACTKEGGGRAQVDQTR